MKTFAVLLFLVGAAMAAAKDGSVTEEYERRSDIVTGLHNKYRQYIKINKEEGKEKSAKLLEEFQSEFVNTFDSSDQWLLDALTSPDGVVKEAMDKNRFHFSLTRLFLREGAALVQTAIRVHYQYQLHENNVTEGARLQHLMERARRQMKEMEEKTLGFIRDTAWKTQFRADVDEFAAKHHDQEPFVNAVVAMLQIKFPFRSWFAMLTPNGLQSVSCLRPGAVQHRSAAVPGHSLLVTQIAGDAAVDKAGAMTMLGHVANSAKTWFKCPKDWAARIMRETAYRCEGRKFGLVAVVKRSGGFPKFVGATFRALTSKVVQRKTVFRSCAEQFSVIVFG